MTQPRQQYHNTVAVADAALAQDRARSASRPIRRSYALWFKYASGDSGLLSAAINTRLTRNGTLTACDIEELHDAHIAPGHVQDKTDRIGARMAGEIDQVLGDGRGRGRHRGPLFAGSRQRRAAAGQHRQSRRRSRHHRCPGAGHAQPRREECAAAGAAAGDVGGDRAASPRDRRPAHRKPDRSPHRARQPPLLRRRARSIDRRRCRATNEPLTLLLADVDRIKIHQ